MQNYTDSYSVSITVFSIDMQAASLVHPLHQLQGVSFPSFTSSKICFVTLPCLRSSPALCSSLSFSLQPGKYMIWFIARILSVQFPVFQLFFCFLRFWFWFLILGTHLSLTSANIFQYLASGIHSAWRALLKCKRWSGETLGVKIYNSSPSHGLQASANKSLQLPFKIVLQFKKHFFFLLSYNIFTFMNFHIYVLVREHSQIGGLSEGLRNSAFFSCIWHGQEIGYRNTWLLSLPCPKLSSPLLRTPSAATCSLSFHWLFFYIAVRVIFPRERLIFPVFYSKSFSSSPFMIQSKPEYSVENGNRKSF